jgi:hypothetical protein
MAENKLYILNEVVSKLDCRPPGETSGNSGGRKCRHVEEIDFQYQI